MNTFSIAAHANSLEKVACGAFSDIGSVSGRQRRDFAGLLTSVATPGRAFSDIGFV
jgi:hypothetical protein